MSSIALKNPVTRKSSSRFAADKPDFILLSDQLSLLLVHSLILITIVEYENAMKNTKY